jgi:hypothetical protein
MTGPVYGGGSAQLPPLGGRTQPEAESADAAKPLSAPAPDQRGYGGDSGVDVRTLHRTTPRARTAPVSSDIAASTASATATAATAAAAEARGLATATGRFSAPDPDRGGGGTVYGKTRHSTDLPDAKSSRLGRLHIGWHTASPMSLSMLGTPAPAAGMILGEDVDQHAVTVRCFRPEPTLVTLVGGVWAAQVLAFRALAMGAVIVILTDDPVTWNGFATRSGAQPGQVTVSMAGEAARSFDVSGPTLVVRDYSGPARPASADIGPWQTQLTVLRRLDEHGVPAIHEGHLVLMQRLDLQEAMLAVTSLRLTGDSALLLQQLEADMLAIVGVGAAQYLWWAGTDTERRLIGTARR